MIFRCRLKVVTHWHCRTSVDSWVPDGWSCDRESTSGVSEWVEFNAPTDTIKVILEGMSVLVLDTTSIRIEDHRSVHVGVGRLKMRDMKMRHHKKCLSWKCETWKFGTKMRDMQMRDVKIRHQNVRHENARHENPAPKYETWKYETWKCETWKCGKGKCGTDTNKVGLLFNCNSWWPSSNTNGPIYVRNKRTIKRITETKKFLNQLKLYYQTDRQSKL